MAYQPGDLIWAKMRGYPHWPARIDLPAKDEVIPAKKFPIFFYGTHETAVMLAKDLLPYEKHKHKYAKSTNRRGFNEALEEIAKTPKIRYGMRGIPEESASEESEASEEEKEKEESDREEETPAETKGQTGQRKRKTSTQETAPAKKKTKQSGDEKEDEEEESDEPVETESEHESSSEDEEEEYKPVSKSRKSKTPAKKATTAKKPAGKAGRRKSAKVISSDSEISEDGDDDDGGSHGEDKSDDDNEEKATAKQLPEPKKNQEAKKTPKSDKQKTKLMHSSAGEKKKQEKSDVEDGEANKVADKKKQEEAERKKQEKLEKLEKKKEEMKERKRQEKLEQKAKKKENEKLEKERIQKEKEMEKEKDKQKELERLERERQKEQEREERQKQKELEKLEWQKQKERLKNPTIHDILAKCDYDLKISLRLEAPDIQQCLTILHRIKEMEISPDVIKKSPTIVQTIKKIRNYKQNNKVRERASELYIKLKSLFIPLGCDVDDTPSKKQPGESVLTPGPPLMKAETDSEMTATLATEDAGSTKDSTPTGEGERPEYDKENRTENGRPTPDDRDPMDDAVCSQDENYGADTSVQSHESGVESHGGSGSLQPSRDSHDNGDGGETREAYSENIESYANTEPYTDTSGESHRQARYDEMKAAYTSSQKYDNRAGYEDRRLETRDNTTRGPPDYRDPYASRGGYDARRSFDNRDAYSRERYDTRRSFGNRAPYTDSKEQEYTRRSRYEDNREGYDPRRSYDNRAPYADNREREYTTRSRHEDSSLSYESREIHEPQRRSEDSNVHIGYHDYGNRGVPYDNAHGQYSDVRQPYKENSVSDDLTPCDMDISSPI